MPLSKNEYKEYIQDGWTYKKKKEKGDQKEILDDHLTKLTAKMERLISKDIHPERIILYSDGPLFCRKSIHGTLLMRMLANAGYKVKS